MAAWCSARHASQRLGVILDSYTVYLDLWVVDADGRVVTHTWGVHHRHVERWADDYGVPHQPVQRKNRCVPT